MTQPPQDRPDYPWGPTEADRGTPAAEQAPGAPEPRTGGATRMGGSEPSTGTAPSAPYTGTPATSAPSTGSPYTGTPATSAAEAPGAYAGTSPAARPGGAGTPVSTIVLLVLSGLAVFTGFFTLAGLPAVVLAIVALTRSGTDPASARRLTNLGWWIFGGLIVLGILLIVVGAVLFASLVPSLTGGYSGTDPFDTSLLLALAAR